MQPITPYLTINGADKALEFYQKAFGATDIFRHPGEDGRLFHARMTINGGIVMMEPPHSAALAQVWRDSLQLDLPVAMASPSLLSGDSPLGRVRGVPTLLTLDRRGRLVTRREGALTQAQIVECLTLADAQ